MTKNIVRIPEAVLRREPRALWWVCPLQELFMQSVQRVGLCQG